MTCCVLCSSTEAVLDSVIRDCSAPQILWWSFGIFFCVCVVTWHTPGTYCMFQLKDNHVSSTKPAAVAGAQWWLGALKTHCIQFTFFSTSPLMKVFFYFLLFVFLQRACSFGGFDLTNRSLHPVISDNDNTVCNSHSSINSTDRIRSLFIYPRLFCFSCMWIRIKTATVCKIPSSLRRRLVFPSAKRSSLWEKRWGSTSPRDTTVLSLNRYAPQTVPKGNVGRTVRIKLRFTVISVS